MNAHPLSAPSDATATGSAHVGTATVLFADVVSSTELRARIGEEAADDLRVAHDRLFSTAIASHAGTVVKHTGDGVMATFNAAVDAVGAAVAIQQAIDSHNRRGHAEPFAVRVGISVGDVSHVDEDCFGLPVIEAQRLESAAARGQILCADIVFRLTRGRGGYEFTSVGDLVLKGLPDPVPAMEVGWAPVVPVAMPRDTPLPSVLSGPRVFPLAGRESELAALVDAWKGAAEGARRVVFVAGEPGIGKTRLAVETALVARSQGAFVLAGRCDEELARPFQPFVEALRFQVGLADDVPASWLGPLGGDLVRLVPELPDQVSGLGAPLRADLEAEQARLFDAVTGWVRATAASAPLLLVLDDLQWADRPTLQMLRHLVRETPNDPLCVIGTYRSTGLDRKHPLAMLIADLQRDGTASRLGLDGLTGDGVGELLGRAAGHDLDDEGRRFAATLVDETGGNPFFVSEIVRHAVESGALVVRDGRWTRAPTATDFGLPESVRDLINRRVARLDDETQRLLVTAAVIGHEFELPILAAAASMQEEPALDGLDGARTAGLVDEVGPDRYRFGHALVRATLLEELTTTRRLRLHRSIVETIERLHGGDLDAYVAELAYHSGQFGSTDPERARHYAVRAGERAYATAAAEDAVAWFERALELTDAGDPLIRVQLLTRIGRAEVASRTGEPRGHLRDAARLAHAHDLPVELAEALLVNVRASVAEGDEPDTERIELLEHALAHLEDEPALRARTMGALARELVIAGDRSRRGPLLDEARALAENSGDPLAIVDVASCSFDAFAFSTFAPGRLQQERAHVADALAAARTLDEPYWVAPMLLWSSVLAGVANDGEQYRAFTAALTELGATSGMTHAGQIVFPQMLATLEGRLVEAEALTVEMAHASAIAPQERLAYTAIGQLGIRREQGRLAELVPVFRLVAGRRPQGAPTLAFLLAETGELDEAADLLRDARSRRFRDVPDDLTWAFVTAMWAEAAALVRDRDAAAQLHALLDPLDGTLCGTGGIWCGPTARLLARFEDLLDDPDAADRHHANAVEQSHQLATPVWVARCQLDWAASRLARGDAERAHALVDAADSTIATLALPALHHQSTDLRQQLGSRSAEPPA
jgi:class 3 adenylate cyclase